MRNYMNKKEKNFNPEMMEEKTLSSKTIFDGKVIHLHLDDILLPDGNVGFREYCTHNGAVCVIPLDSDGNVICVRQYRYAIGKPLLEIPAGKLDSPAENPDDAVRRELREETGATSEKITRSFSRRTFSRRCRPFATASSSSTRARSLRTS